MRGAAGETGHKLARRAEAHGISQFPRSSLLNVRPAQRQGNVPDVETIGYVCLMSGTQPRAPQKPAGIARYFTKAGGDTQPRAAKARKTHDFQ